MKSALNKEYLNHLLKSQPKSTTKLIEQEELDVFSQLFKDALNIQDPAVRQIFIAFTNKLIKRIKDSHRVVMREVKRYTDADRTVITKRYLDFLTSLVRYCFDGIYCNAYFGSYTLIMSTLKIIINHITFFDANLPIEELFKDRRCYDSILSCLNDSFEENKALALDLLFAFPHKEHLLSCQNLSRLEEIAYELVSSVNPAHSMTCHYIFKFIIGLEVKKFGSQFTKNQLVLRKLQKLTDLVETGVQETRENSVLALKHNALYPKLTCIRALLTEVDIEDIPNLSEEWKTLARRIVVNSIQACQSVSMIVCNLNPETIGHLPMDLKPIDVEALFSNLKISLDVSKRDLSTITSQLLLISGWKTIKECSLSLGSLCTRFWWPEGGIPLKRQEFPGLRDVEPILEDNDIIDIIKFFDHYLRNLRHRGAFEQAYNGFIMVTKRVWFEKQFRDLLIDMLHNIMNDFKSEALDPTHAEYLKAYVTRRSAGLPFIVQAILISEPRQDSKILRWIMDSLYEVLHNEHTETYQRIHCLNILKAVIKEHFLGEKISCYVGETFALTLDSLTSDSFPIRNCANMLLKATVDRTFGANRSKSDIHRKNQITFGKFFNDCQNLHSKMIETLRLGCESKVSIAAVHAVFIILYRLRPNQHPNDSFMTTEELIVPFMQPILDIIYKCPDLKLREIGANIAARFESYLANDEIKLDIDFFENIDLSNSNAMHGFLLLIREMLKTGAYNRNNSLLNLAQKTVIDVLNLPRNNQHSSCLKSIAIDILDIFLAMRLGNMEIELINPGSLTWIQDEELDVPDPYFELYLVKRLSLMSIYPSKYRSLHITKLLEFITRDGRWEIESIQASMIRFIRQKLAGPRCFVDELLDKLDIDLTPIHITPIDRLKMIPDGPLKDALASYYENDDSRDDIMRNLDNDMLFSFYLFNEFKPNTDSKGRRFSPKFSNTSRAIELLALAAKFWDKLKVQSSATWYKRGETSIEKLNFLYEFISNLQDCDVKCLGLVCVGKILKHELTQVLNVSDSENDIIPAFHISVMEKLASTLDELADGDHSVTIRESCCEVLGCCLELLVAKRCEQLQHCLISILSCLVKLSQDEDPDIRCSCYKIIENLRNLSPSYRDSTASRLDHLVHLITSRLFDRNEEQEVNNCFQLLMRIIFNHSKNYSTDANEDREALFDKTRLNTFADHIATIRSALGGLEHFFLSPGSEPVHVNSLSFSRELIAEFEHSLEPPNKDSGDYSWRVKRIIDQSFSVSKYDKLDNEQRVDIFIESILSSLEYFAGGYYNMLTDTSYTYHELSLYKKIAFLNFITSCTKSKLKNRHLLQEIKSKLARIVRDSCSTTLLMRCLDLMTEI